MSIINITKDCNKLQTLHDDDLIDNQINLCPKCTQLIWMVVAEMLKLTGSVVMTEEKYKRDENLTNETVIATYQYL